jgi:DNA-binding transcriptional LysR family regulator
MSRASERLYITQPAISAHIKTLESGLGISLFERVGRRSVVNSAGQVLYEKAERVFEAVDDLKAAMENVRGSPTGRLRLGASVVWQYCLPGVLHQFKRKFPLVDLSTQVANSDLVERLVLDRTVDIGFIARASSRTELYSEQLAEDEVVAICGPAHPLLGMT